MAPKIAIENYGEEQAEENSLGLLKIERSAARQTAHAPFH
jgi:hypothetical protein